MAEISRPVLSGAGAIESRDPRFAELDVQIEAENEARQQKSTAPKPNRRRRPGPRLPAVVRKEITQCARQLRQHQRLFKADAKLKDRAARVLRSMLPPKRKRGRPGIPGVTQAILLLKQLQRERPEQQPKERWQQVYRKVISDYTGLTRDQQRAQEVLLREQVRSRRNQQRKRTVADRHVIITADGTRSPSS